MKTTKRRKVVLEYTVEHEALAPGWRVEKWPPFPKQENAFETVKFIESRPGDVVLSREASADLLRLTEVDPGDAPAMRLALAVIRRAILRGRR